MSTPTRPPQKFRTTRWSLVLRSRGQGEEARGALEDLCKTYWFPLFGWCRSKGLSAADAEDMVQGFFVRVFEKDLFSAADRDIGKLRTFLLTVLQRHVKDEQRRANSLRRGGGQVVSFDAVQADEWYHAERIDGENPDHFYDRQWALTVLDNAVLTLEQQFAERRKDALFAALRPFLNSEGSAAEYEKAAPALGMNAGAFKVAVHRLRTKFRDALRSEVAGTQPDGSSIDEEIAYLMEILRRRGAPTP